MVGAQDLLGKVTLVKAEQHCHPSFCSLARCAGAPAGGFSQCYSSNPKISPWELPGTQLGQKGWRTWVGAGGMDGGPEDPDTGDISGFPCTMSQPSSTSGLISRSLLAPFSMGKAQSQHGQLPKSPHSHPCLLLLQGGSEGLGGPHIGACSASSSHVPALSLGQNMDAVFIFDLCQAKKEIHFLQLLVSEV